MTNQQLLAVAKRQSAIDSGCRAADFDLALPQVVLSRPHAQARRYLKLPFFCDLTSYGSNVVASVCPEAEERVRDYLSRFPAYRCFETPALHLLSSALQELELGICFMAEYFLPDLDRLDALPCPYEIRLLEPPALEAFYTPAWSNALCAQRRQLDRLALAAYDGSQCVGMAGASADCDAMWQIGIDVLPAYRRQGIAKALTSRLALEILHRGLVPFYCCAWSNLPSARNAIASGFRPAWVQLTARPLTEIAAMNRPPV